MSLDVYLRIPKEPETCWCAKCGHEHKSEIDYTEVFESNITHNLVEMADKAGIYKECWRPEEIGITKAEQLIEPLTKGLADLEARPEYFEQFNASNGWGLYKHFVPFVRKYLEACKQNPESKVEVSR